MSADNADQLLRRMRWACKRGMLELDLMLIPYVEQRYLYADRPEQQCFEALLQCEDQQLYSWLLQSSQPPADFQALISRIRTLRQQASADKHQT